jgi:hypothetical protein
MQAVRDWDARSRQSDPDLQEIKCRVAREITPYLGSQAADRILQAVAEGGDDLLARIEAVLALFLGTRTAGELTGHIVDATIVRP